MLEERLLSSVSTDRLSQYNEELLTCACTCTCTCTWNRLTPLCLRTSLSRFLLGLPPSASGPPSLAFFSFLPTLLLTPSPSLSLSAPVSVPLCQSHAPSATEIRTSSLRPPHLQPRVRGDLGHVFHFLPSHRGFYS